jgi:hypothetical protein
MRKLAFVCGTLAGADAVAVAVGGCARSEAQTQPPAAAADTPPAVPAPPPAPAGKAHAEGQGYTVDVKPPATAAVGAEAKAHVVLHPTAGYHVNKEFPMILTVTAPPGVDVPKAKQAGADAAKLEETEAVFDIPFTAKEAGDKAFAASFRFAVCTATTCDPHNEKLAWNVSAK